MCVIATRGSRTSLSPRRTPPSDVPPLVHPLADLGGVFHSVRPVRGGQWPVEPDDSRRGIPPTGSLSDSSEWPQGRTGEAARPSVLARSFRVHGCRLTHASRG